MNSERLGIKSKKNYLILDKNYAIDEKELSESLQAKSTIIKYWPYLEQGNMHNSSNAITRRYIKKQDITLSHQEKGQDPSRLKLEQLIP